MGEAADDIYSNKHIYKVMMRALRQGEVKASDLEKDMCWRYAGKLLSNLVAQGIMTSRLKTEGHKVIMYSLTPKGRAVALSMMLGNQVYTGELSFEDCDLFEKIEGLLG